MDINLSKLPWYVQVGSFVLIAALGIGAYYYYYEMPAREDIANREKQLAAIRVDINKGLTTARKLQEFKADVAKLEARLSNLRAILPEDKDAGVLVRQFQTVAAQSNIT